MPDDIPELPDESAGLAPGRGRLDGRRILIVGAGQSDYGLDDPPIGNGRAMAVLCAREGALISLVDRDVASLGVTVDLAVRETGAGGVHTIVCDVAEPSSLQDMVERSVEALGGLDGVVYNVGIGAGSGLAATSIDDWDRVFSVNVRGAMLTAKAALPVLPAGSSIVFISSLAGLKPGTGMPSYDSSKAAMHGLMRHVAAEGSRQGVRANVIAPGLMDTSLGRFATAARPARAKSPIPLRRQGTAWETATWPCSCSRTRPPTSPAKSSPSTADCRRCDSASRRGLIARCA